MKQNFTVKFGLLGLLVMLLQIPSRGQLVSGDVFLKGQYVEVGVAPNGTFGSQYDAPAGYHGRSVSTSAPAAAIGFVADPDKDGWTVGTPAFYGDYFMPQAPYQGWGLEVNGVRYYSDRNASATAGVTGSNTSFSTSGGVQNGVWEGSADSVNIVQTTILDSSKLYFVVSIKLKNTAHTDKLNVYYMQMVNPDNDAHLNNLNTYDTIKFQNPNVDNKTLVVARGFSTKAYLGLGSKDCRAKVFLGSTTWGYLTSNYKSAFAGGASGISIATGGRTFGNNAIGILFKVDTLAAGDSTSFAYTYILKEADLDTAFLAVKSNWMVNGDQKNSKDTIYGCPGSNINLNIANGSAFNWSSWTPSTGLSTTSGTSNTVTVGTTPVTYRVVGNSIFSACGAISDTLFLTVAPYAVPTAPVATSPIKYCAGATASVLTATKPSATDTLKWYTVATGGTALAAAPTPSTGTATTLNYYVSATSQNGCEGTRTNVSVQVNPLPTAPTVTSPKNICESASATALTATKSSATDTLYWYTAATGGTGSLTAPTPATSTPTVTNYYVSQRNSFGCEGSRTLLQARINPKPSSVTVSAGGPTSFCNGDSVTLTGAVTIASIGTTNMVTSSSATGTTYSCDCPNGYVAVGYQGRVGSWMDNMAIICKPIDRFGALGSTTAVTTTNGSSGGGVAVGPYLLTGTNVLVGANVNSNGTNLNGVTGYAQSLSYITGLGNNTTGATTLTSLAGGTPYYDLGNLWAPDGHVFTGMVAYPSVYASGVQFKYASLGAYKYTYAWSSGGAADTNQSLVAKTSGNYTLTVTNSFGCSTTSSAITVTANPLPSAPTVTSPVNYCVGATASALTATGSSLKWYTSATGGTALSGAPTPSTAASGTTTYWVSQTSGASCEGARASITVNVNPLPSAPTVGTTSYTYCQNATATALSATGTNLKWYTVATGGTGSATAPTPSTATAGTFNWWVSQTISATSCEGPRTMITVTVNPTPAAPTTSAVAYCQGTAATALTAGGSGLLWYSASTGGTGTATAPTPGTATPGTTTYYVSQTNSFSCESPRSSLTVTVNPTPTAPTVVSPLNLCIGVPASALTATGTNLKWYDAATGGTMYVGTPIPSTAVTGSTNYYVSQSTSVPCEGPRQLLNVIVRPLPSVTITTPSPYGFVFCKNLNVVLKANSATAVAYQWKWETTVAAGSTFDTVRANKTGKWTVTVTDNYGCKKDTNQFVQQDTSKTPVLSPLSAKICEDGSALLTCSPGFVGYTFKWRRDGSMVSSSPYKDHLLNAGVAGAYNVIVTNTIGCIDTTNDCVVTYYPKPVKPVLNYTAPNLSVAGGYTYYQWYKDAKSIFKANAPTQRVIANGKYYVSVTDANGCTANSDTLTIELPNSIAPAQLNRSVKIYPNPTRNRITVESPVVVDLQVMDMTGKILMRKEKATEMDLSSFADGVYFIMIQNAEDGQKIAVERIVKTATDQQ